MRLRAALLATLVVGSALPFTIAAAEDLPCDEGQLVLTAEGDTVDYDAPDAVLETGDDLVVALDLSGTEFKSGTVTVTATWTVEQNDYDLFVNDEGPLETSLLAGGATSENASSGKLGHCDTFVVRVDNFLAADPLDAVTLGFDVRAR